MKYLLICILVSAICLPSNLSAQNFGYLGKKNQFSFFSTGGLRIAPITGILMFGDDNIADSYRVVTYPTSGPGKVGRKLFRYDLRASYSRLLNPRIALGVEFAYEKNKISQPEGYDEYVYDETTGQTYYQTAELISSPVFNCYSYMLTMEIFNQNSIAQTGWSNAFGIGPKFYSFNNSIDYKRNSTTVIQKTFPDYQSNMMAINFFYQISYKHPLTRFMVFDIGMRFHTGVLLKNGPDPWAYKNDYMWSKESLYNKMFIDNFMNLLSLKMGFGFLL